MAHEFTASLYNTNSPENALEKVTTTLHSGITVREVKPRGYKSIDISILLDTDGEPINYVLLIGNHYTATSGYYFVRDKIRMPGGVTTLICEKDILSTYKDYVKGNMSGTLVESLSGDPYLDNGTFITECKEEIEQKDFPGGFNEIGQYILITSGGA